jgi:small subunit ribosomal protein S8
MSDPIADFLTRIRNSLAVGKAEVRMPYSRLKHSLADVLVNAGFIKSASKIDEGYGVLRIELKYAADGTPSLQHLRRISTPGRRVYQGYQAVRSVCSGRGVAVFSTSSGLLTDRQVKQQKVGGELLCELW